MYLYLLLSFSLFKKNLFHCSPGLQHTGWKLIVSCLGINHPQSYKTSASLVLWLYRLVHSLKQMKTFCLDACSELLFTSFIGPQGRISDLNIQKICFRLLISQCFVVLLKWHLLMTWDNALHHSISAWKRTDLFITATQVIW